MLDINQLRYLFSYVNIPLICLGSYKYSLHSYLNRERIESPKGVYHVESNRSIGATVINLEHGIGSRERGAKGNVERNQGVCQVP
mgnify:CR=1 FL=1